MKYLFIALALVSFELAAYDQAAFNADIDELHNGFKKQCACYEEKAKLFAPENCDALAYQAMATLSSEERQRFFAMLKHQVHNECNGKELCADFTEDEFEILCKMLINTTSRIANNIFRL